MFLIIDTISGIILEESDTKPDFEDGWMGIRKNGMFTMYSAYPVIRVKQVTQEQYEEFEERASALVTGPRGQAVDGSQAEGYDDGELSDEQRSDFYRKYMSDVLNQQ